MGCQTTQSANKDTKPADIEPIITEEKKPINPYAKKEIPEDLQIMTSKPIVCGRVDKVLIVLICEPIMPLKKTVTFAAVKPKTWLEVSKNRFLFIEKNELNLF